MLALFSPLEPSLSVSLELLDSQAERSRQDSVDGKSKACVGKRQIRESRETRKTDAEVHEAEEHCIRSDQREKHRIDGSLPSSSILFSLFIVRAILNTNAVDT